MFKSKSLSMPGDHLDVSFHSQESWPSLPWKSIRGVAFRVGDPVVGPSINLASVTPSADEPLDWEHHIDPMHFHGTDQFRLLLEGEWVTTRHPFSRGEFGFQESGWVYQEHPGDCDRSWLFLVYGDRRGEAATLTLQRDREELLVDGVTDIAGAPLAVGEYRHPAGPKGIAAVLTTAGAPQRGHLWGSFAEPAAWQPLEENLSALAGLFGDPVGGPMVIALACGPDRVAVPESTYATEVVLTVSGGSCFIGGVAYHAGDIRVQRDGATLPEVTSGPDGVQITCLLGDRRQASSCRTASDDAGLRWQAFLSATVEGLAAGVAGK